MKALKHNFILVTLLLCVNTSYSQFEISVAKDLAPNKFNKDFKEYDRSTAVYCAQLSNIIYEPDNAINSFVEALNFLHPDANYKYEFVQHKETSTELMFFGNQDFLIIAFRGTQEGKDFKTDAKFLGYKTKVDSSENPKYPYLPTGHAGFRRSLMSIIDSDGINVFGKLENFIVDSLHSSKGKMPVYITGHSLGAALSHMFILPLKNRGYNYSGSYNFAPPLAIWKTSANEIIENSEIHNVTYDIVNNTDWITRMPGYGRKKMKHIGKFYRICYSDKDRLEPKIYKETERYFKFLKREKVRFKVIYDRYHRMQHYLNAVSNVNNTFEKIVKRSSELGKGCSCLGGAK